MAKQFTVREESGMMVAKLGREVVNRLMVDIAGHWGKGKDGKKHFYVEEDCTFGLGSGDSVMRMFFWEGYTITEDE